MRIHEFITESFQEMGPNDANWANVVKSSGHVTFYKSMKPPFTPGRTTVWFRKVGDNWEEYGDHGRYDYSDILKKRLQQ